MSGKLKRQFKGSGKKIRRYLKTSKIFENPLVDTDKTEKRDKKELTFTPIEIRRLNKELLEAAKNNIEKIKFILKFKGYGVDVNFHYGDGWTALMIAANEDMVTGRFKNGNGIEICKLLIKNGANVNTQNTDGRTALMLASEGDYLEMCRLLVESGADVNIQDNNGRTALMNVVTWKNRDIKIVKYLLSVGANPLLKNKQELIAYDLASTNEIMQILEKYTEIWKLIGEKNVLLIQHSIRNCESDKIQEIFQNL